MVRLVFSAEGNACFPLIRMLNEFFDSFVIRGDLLTGLFYLREGNGMIMLELRIPLRLETDTLLNKHDPLPITVVSLLPPDSYGPSGGANFHYADDR